MRQWPMQRLQRWQGNQKLYNQKQKVGYHIMLRPWRSAPPHYLGVHHQQLQKKK